MNKTFLDMYYAGWCENCKNFESGVCSKLGICQMYKEEDDER